MTGARLWLVLCDPELREQWRRLTKRQGWEVEAFADLSGFLRAAKPGETGLAVLEWSCLGPSPGRLLRTAKGKVPNASFLAAVPAGRDDSELAAILETGIDDCLLTPLKPEALLARLESHLHRLAGNGETLLGPSGDLKLDCERREVWARLRGKWRRAAALTPIESKLLELFLKNPGAILERRFLLETLWPGEAVWSGTVAKHVESLRHKLGKAGSRLRAVYGLGYAYRE